jgi:MFS family permease
MNRNVLILAFCQAILFSGIGLVISSSALIGKNLAPDAAWATLPLALQYLTTMLVIYYVSSLMKEKGRRYVFTRGALIGTIGLLVASLGIWLGNFMLFALSSILIGIHTAIGQFYRFAAAESVATEYKAKAISLTLAGGVLAAFIGPNLAIYTKNLLEYVFLASYLTMVVMNIVVAYVSSKLTLPSISVDLGEGRPLLKIATQPKYLLAIIAAMIGYGVMNFLMTATPLAMSNHDHSFASTASVIQWHLFAMFAPSFITGDLIRKFGVLQIMLVGCLLLLSCAFVNLNGTSFLHFESALILLGIGWNFLYIGATTLLTDTYSPHEKAKAQGLNDTFVFATLTLTSLASGALVENFGWQSINFYSIPPVLIVVLGLTWLILKRRSLPEAQQQL